MVSEGIFPPFEKEDEEPGIGTDAEVPIAQVADQAASEEEQGEGEID